MDWDYPLHLRISMQNTQKYAINEILQYVHIQLIGKF